MTKQKQELLSASERRPLKITRYSPNGLNVSIKGTCKLTLINNH